MNLVLGEQLLMNLRHHAVMRLNLINDENFSIYEKSLLVTTDIVSSLASGTFSIGVNVIMGKFEFGKFSHCGPCHHKLLFNKLCDSASLVIKSEGFSSDFTWFQFKKSVSSLISQIQFST